MASSAAVVSPPPPKTLTSDNCDEDEESEYEEIEEEIEVEEEVEVEEEIEEVEVEEEFEEEVEANRVEREGVDEIGEDLTPIRQANQGEDSNQIMEVDEHADYIQSDCVANVTSASNPPMDVPTMRIIGDYKPSKSSDREEFYAIGERTSKDNNQKSPNDSGEINHSNPIPTGDANASSTMVGASGQKDDTLLSIRAETNHTAIEAVGTTRQISQRLHLPQIRPRDPSSSAEFDGENKKLRVACEFYAQGWCIRGHSCRFLHIKDELDAELKKTEAVEGEASPITFIPPLQSLENPKLNGETGKLVLHKDNTLGSSSLVKDGLTTRNSSYHGSFSAASHDNHQNDRVSEFGTKKEEMKSDIMQINPRPADLPYSHPRQPLSFGSSLWNSKAYGTQNFWESGLEHRAFVSSSLLRSIPPVSHSVLETALPNHNFRDIRPAKTVFSFSDWEPSAPFRPSHVITRNLLKENLYDPIRDSIMDQKDVGDGRIKFSHSDQGSSVKEVNVQSNSQQEEEKFLNSVQAGVATKDNIVSSSCDDKLKFDKAREEPALEAVGSDKNDETYVDFKHDSHIQSESKALKYFQAALIEFVKDLVRPTWNTGLISKDVHKLIVKKAVDKVLSTFQPYQIPSSGESIKLYLSSSHHKLVKLVEGYIDKYGKS